MLYFIWKVGSTNEVLVTPPGFGEILASPYDFSENLRQPQIISVTHVYEPDGSSHRDFDWGRALDFSLTRTHVIGGLV